MAPPVGRFALHRTWVLAGCLLTMGLAWVLWGLHDRAGPGQIQAEYHSASVDDTEVTYFTREGGIALVIWNDFTVC